MWCNGCARDRSRFHAWCDRTFLSYGWILPFVILFAPGGIIWLVQP